MKLSILDLLTSVVVVQAATVRLPITHRLRADIKPITGTIYNNISAYFAEFQVGTPGQPVQSIFDTGSSDLWIYGKQSGVVPSYDSSSSSTYQELGQTFDIEYGQGTGAHGEYITDVVHYGDFSIGNQQLAVVNDPTEPTDGGIMGVGMVGNEASSFSYPNLPANLADQGIITVNAFSLYLDDYESSSGSVLFGGIDSEKYTGELTSVDIEPSNSPEFTVPTTYGNDQSLALLDSGTTLMYLPSQVVSSITSELGATYSSANGAWFLKSKPSKSISFTVGSATIEISGQELAIDASPFFESPPGPYLLPITATSDTFILGQSFLRSAYVVFDSDGHRVLIAQASYSSESNVFDITPEYMSSI